MPYCWYFLSHVGRASEPMYSDSRSAAKFLEPLGTGLLWCLQEVCCVLLSDYIGSEAPGHEVGGTSNKAQPPIMIWCMARLNFASRICRLHPTLHGDQLWQPELMARYHFVEIRQISPCKSRRRACLHLLTVPLRVKLHKKLHDFTQSSKTW